MTYFFYNLVASLFCLVLFPYLLIRGIWGKHGMAQRLGFIPGSWKQILKQNQVIWVHVASVGEAKMLPAIVPELKKMFPQVMVAVSVMTKSGKGEAQKCLKDEEFIFHPPLDLPWFTRRTVRSINPSLLVLTETELWPNLIREAKRSGSKIVLINGRISGRSFPRYRRLTFLFSKVLSFIDAFCMRSQLDARRIISIGAPPGKVNVVGNIKFDQIFFREQDLDEKLIGSLAPLLSKKRIIVAGSTHPGEEEIVLRTYKKLTFSHPDLFLIIAPRHLNHLGELEKFLDQCGLCFIKKTQVNSNLVGFKPAVMILDTLGELNQFYGLASMAFIGGSLVPKGGHNLLEPVRFSIPVLFGPHMDNFQEIANLLKASGGGIEVKDETQLHLKMNELLLDENKRRNLGRMAKDAVTRQGSATEKIALILSKVW